MNIDKSLPILLTGTIIPNSIIVKHADYMRRREEYLKAIHYYLKFGPVIFLENSTYDIENDKDFQNLAGVQIVKFKPSLFPQKGKGFQEFEMIDTWIKTEKILPQHFIKITGRYIIKNFKSFYDACKIIDSEILIIDSYKKTETSLTSLFSTSTEFYRKNLINLYLEADDSSGCWIEKVLYKKLALSNLNYRIFHSESRVDGISGSTGKSLRISVLKYFIRVLRRKINLLLDTSVIFL